MSAEELKFYCGGCTVNLETLDLNDEMGKKLAALIEENNPAIKHIVTTQNNLSRETIVLILNALKKNNYITQFSFEYKKNIQLAIEIKTQLMLNKAVKYIMPREDNDTSLFWKIFAFLRLTRGLTGMIMLQFAKIFSWKIVAACILIYQGLIKFVVDPYFKSEYRKIKEENTTVASLNNNPSYLFGKRCNTERLVWLDPRSWTPLAYLGYQVAKNGREGLEKEKLSEELLKKDTEFYYSDLRT